MRIPSIEKVFSKKFREPFIMSQMEQNIPGNVIIELFPQNQPVVTLLDVDKKIPHLIIKEERKFLEKFW